MVMKDEPQEARQAYHHFDAPLTDSINNFLSLGGVCYFQLLLKKDGRLLVG